MSIASEGGVRSGKLSDGHLHVDYAGDRSDLLHRCGTVAPHIAPHSPQKILLLEKRHRGGDPILHVERHGVDEDI